LRRQLRAVISAHASALADGAAYLFSAGPAAARLPYRELDAVVAELIATSAEDRP